MGILIKLSRKPEGITRVGVSGLLWRNGKILLGLRHAGDASLPNQWCTPGGGVEFQEKLSDALIREFKEETHLDITVGDVVTVTQRIPTDLPHRHSVLVFYRVFSYGEPEIGEDFSNLRWFYYDELKDIVVTEQTMAAIEHQFRFFANSQKVE